MFRVTHPFHPLRGRAFELVSVRQTWGEYRVFYYNEAGTLVALPAPWTDAAPVDPCVAIAQLPGRRAIVVVQNWLDEQLAERPTRP